MDTTGRLVFAKACHLDPAKLKVEEAEYRSLEAAASSYSWTRPGHPPSHDVQKGQLLAPLWSPPSITAIPCLQDFFNMLHTCSHLSVVNLDKGHHRVPMVPADVPKATIVMPFGLFKYLHMLFGL